MRQRGIPHDQNLNGGAIYSTTPENPMSFKGFATLKTSKGALGRISGETMAFRPLSASLATLEYLANLIMSIIAI